MIPSREGPRLLLVGGSGGLVGRSVLPKFAPGWRIRSLHRNPVPAETAAGVEWVRGDVATANWPKLLDGVNCVLNVAWYRWASARVFRDLEGGLERLMNACQAQSKIRFLHLSVPSAPEALETDLPYLALKRKFDAALFRSGLSYRILRPTMLFGPGDRLLGVMLRLMSRYHRFPMFGDGRYRVSPISAEDLARILVAEAESATIGTRDLGGPVTYEYRALTDRMFAALGRDPRYFHLSKRGALAVTRLMRAFGSQLLYPYEVEWLMSDQLALPPADVPGAPLARVEPYLDSEARRLGARANQEQV